MRKCPQTSHINIIFQYLSKYIYDSEIHLCSEFIGTDPPTHEYVMVALSQERGLIQPKIENMIFTVYLGST